MSMSELPYDVITIGDMCVDLLVDVGDAHVDFGQVENWVEDYLLELGGSTCIFACQAAKLGLRVAILGQVGDDAFGQLIVRRLSESRVDTRFVTVEPSQKTGLSVVLCRPDGNRAILTFGGSLNAVTPTDVTDEFLSSGRHLHYGSYYLLTNLQPSAADILRRARSFGSTVSLDTNWDPANQWNQGLNEILPMADLFFPNEQEANAITGIPDAEQAVRRLGQVVPIVAVKLGERGSMVRAGESVFSMPVAAADHVIDTVGAGDSFDAGFLAAWLRGLGLDDCAAIGNACGRATVQQRGGVGGQLWAQAIPQFASRPIGERTRGPSH
jgi:sugar/nucleoside kinase (ribokinase family)